MSVTSFGTSPSSLRVFSILQAHVEVSSDQAKGRYRSHLHTIQYRIPAGRESRAKDDGLCLDVLAIVQHNTLPIVAESFYSCRRDNINFVLFDCREEAGGRPYALVINADAPK